MLHPCNPRAILFAIIFVIQGVTSFLCPTRRCPDIPVEPICGTDMRTYKNLCKLRESSCKNGKSIKIAYVGRCTECEDKETARKLLIRQFFEVSGSPCQKFGIPNDQTLKMCLQMNFLKLDKTKRHYVKYKTFSILFRELKKYRKSRKCLKTMAKHCDVNKDKKVTEDEFIGCFITSTSSERTARCTGKSRDFSCLKDGKYAAQQCVLNVCYCSADDGNVIIHFKEEEKQKYDCTKVRENWEARKKLTSKCTESDMEDLISKYKISIEDEIIAKAPNVIKPVKTSIENFLAERGFRSMHTINKLLVWKFKQLDRNKNGALQENELKVVKNELEDISPLCTNSLLNSCNVNQDLYITKKEWRICLGFKKDGAFVPKKKKKKNEKGKKILPTRRTGGCPPVAFCTLSCNAGFERDKNGCITCKCRDFLSFLTTWKGDIKT